MLSIYETFWLMKNITSFLLLIKTISLWWCIAYMLSMVFLFRFVQVTNNFKYVAHGKFDEKSWFHEGNEGKISLEWDFFTRMLVERRYFALYFSLHHIEKYISQTKPITLYQLFYVYFLFLLGKFIHKSAYDEFHQNVMRSLYRHFRLRA